MTGQSPKGPAPNRRRPKSEVLTKKQFFVILTFAGLTLLGMAVLFWRGFPVGNTLMPILIGLSFIVGMGFSIKTGVLNWKGGGRMLRDQEPVAFWFWVLVFLVAGLFSLLIGLVELTHVMTPN